jgi:hypothetical protein
MQTSTHKPNPISGGHEYESPAQIELGVLTEGGKTLGVRSSYKGCFCDHLIEVKGGCWVSGICSCVTVGVLVYPVQP